MLQCSEIKDEVYTKEKKRHLGVWSDEKIFLCQLNSKISEHRNIGTKFTVSHWKITTRYPAICYDVVTKPIGIYNTMSCVFEGHLKFHYAEWLCRMPIKIGIKKLKQAGVLQTNRVILSFIVVVAINLIRLDAFVFVVIRTITAYPRNDLCGVHCLLRKKLILTLSRRPASGAHSTLLLLAAT